MSARSYFKMSCRYCAGHIEYPAHAVGEQTDCPHCSKAIILTDDAAFDVFGTKRGELTRLQLKRVGNARLADFKAAGIGFVKVLPSGVPEAVCAAVQQIADKTFAISEVPPLPLPNCDKKRCHCIHISAPQD